MAQLTLSIKQNFFDDILSGTKKNEIREIRPGNTVRYCLTDSNGNITGTKKYDTLKLITGQFKGKRPYLIVEVISSIINYWEDDYTQEPIILFDGDSEYQFTTIEYKLGEILYTSLCNVLIS